MATSKKDNGSKVQAYLRSWERRKATGSEGDIYDIFATHIVRGLLGYGADEYNITPRKKRGGGAPDLRLKTVDGEWWVAVEAKKDDGLIRREADRARLWRDKRKYVDDQTAYFLWVGPKTFLLCDAAGNPIVGVRMETGQTELDLELDEQVWHSSADDEEIGRLLSPISAEAGRERRYLDLFREGKLPYGHITVTRETIGLLTSSLHGAVDILLSYLGQSLVALRDGYENYCHERSDYEARLRSGYVLTNPEVEQRIGAALRSFDRANSKFLRFHQAFDDFVAEQAYTKFEKVQKESDRAALERIFRANAAYVAIGRLFFVRLAEDQKLIQPKISNGGLEAWNKVLGNGGLVAQWVGLAFADAKRVCEQLFAETPFDSLMLTDDPIFDRALLRILYRLNAFDLSNLARDVDVLGQIYQGILDRKLRKDVGEFYTDQEIVEYILARIGLKEAVESGQPVRLLDPACGSGAFLVRAAGIMREADSKRSLPKPDIQERVNAAVHGLDINHFAVYIADMNLLFATFDLAVETGQASGFSIHRINSLLKPVVLSADTVLQTEDTHRDAAEDRDSTYDFVVGNPPYIRAERLPDEDRSQLKRLYWDMHGEGNVDLAVYFVRRALEWLNDGGRLGFILPRAIADSGFARPLRTLLEGDCVTIEEMVPLDWVAHELFDSDVVPFLLFLRKSPRPKDHKVTLVQCLRCKDDILGRSRDQKPAGVRTSKIPWAEFSRQSYDGWPLEVTSDDLPVLKVLGKYDTLDSIAEPRYGIKAGSTGAARDTGKGQPIGEPWRPLLTGADIHAFFADQPRRAVLLDKADDPSVWTVLLPGRKGDPLPAEMVAVPVIHITLNAAVLDPSNTYCQDTIAMVRPRKENKLPVHALAALMNSRVSRYYAFLRLRSSVVGGGRRDWHVFPRTISALRVPKLSECRWNRLANLSRIAHAAGSERATADQDIWRRIVPKKGQVLIREWPVNFSGWPDGTALPAEEFAPQLDETGTVLFLGKDISIAGETHLLTYLGFQLQSYFAEADDLSKTALVRMKVASTNDVPKVLEEYRVALEDRKVAEKRYRKALKIIDDIVEKGFGLTPELRERVSRRMSEFPLNENANRPRLPWEMTRKPKGRRFELGERYHEV